MLSRQILNIDPNSEGYKMKQSLSLIFQKIKVIPKSVALLSCLWIASISFIYFHEITYYPSQIAVNNPNIFGKQFYDAFAWKKDVAATHKAHMEAIKKGKDFSYKIHLVSPKFSLLGYAKLVFLPLYVVWLFLTIMNYFWRRREELISKLGCLNYKIDIQKQFFVCLATLVIILLYIFDKNLVENLLVISAVGVASLLSWYFFVKGMAYLFYAVTKAISNANKD